jgi:hypothetical protein
MLIHAETLTWAFLGSAVAVGLLLLRLLLPHGQHASAGDGALSVARLHEEAAAEARARAETGRHRAIERPPPRRVHSAWIEPPVAVAA